MAENYDTLDALPEDVIKPYKFMGKNKVVESGTMENHQTFIRLLQCGEAINVPKGWHSGFGYIGMDSTESQTRGNVTEDTLAIGKYAFSNGVLIEGKVPVYGDSQSVGSDMRYTAPYLYVSLARGMYQSLTNTVNIEFPYLASTISIDANKIRYGDKVCQVNGTFSADATVTADKLRKGKTIFAKGVMITGTLEVPTLY